LTKARVYINHELVEFIFSGRLRVTGDAIGRERMKNGAKENKRKRAKEKKSKWEYAKENKNVVERDRP